MSSRLIILNWDLSRVRDYLINRKKMEPTMVEKLIVEYRRFMILTVENPDTLIPIAGPVDDVWHTHILFSKDYCEFGQAVAGGYIHHSPTVSDEEAGELKGSYHENTFHLYRMNFGEMDASLWGENYQVCLCNGIAKQAQEPAPVQRSGALAAV